MLATLNHPHIGAIYGLEKDDGQLFLVLELIEGETLAERIDRGPLPVAEAVPLAIQIAQGLEVAHESGMIHRDLKPANIKITPDGEVKVLDFGLAKPTEAVFSGDFSQSPTLTYSPTGVGVLLGTAAYMSPEQVRGKEVDRRTDVWAFGVVLWEMLTGKKLFQGDTVSDILASTLMREPDWEGLPQGLPAGVTRVLRHCLVQEPKERLHDIADARIDLQEAFDEPEISATVTAPPPAWWKRALPWVVVPLALAGGWFLRPEPEIEPRPVVRFEVRTPEGEQIMHRFRHGVALSPDGSELAFTSGTFLDAYLTPQAQIFLRRFDQRGAQPVLGTQGGSQPIFSPDGEWLAFITDDPARLLKVPSGGGESQTLCECDATFGASWGQNGTIVFAAERGPLQEVSSVGGEPRPLTELLEADGETGHRLPHFLPDGSALIFTSMYNYRDWDQSQIVAYSPSTAERKVLIQGGSDGQYVDSGHLVFARQGKLLAVGFDPVKLETFGEVTPVLEGVNHSIFSLTSSWRTGAANLSVSSSGSLAYLAGSVFPETPKGMVIVDRQGNKVEVERLEQKQFLSARVSPEGRRVLLSTHYYPDSVWVFDMDRESLSRETFEGRQGWAVWGPGPDEFTTASYQDGAWQIFSKSIGSGPGSRRVLWTGEREIRVSSWSPDGRHLALVSSKSPLDQRDSDVWILSPDGNLTPLLDSNFWEAYPEFSPNGRWIAYTSGESGRGEVYVRPFPGPGSTVQISTSGGWTSIWSRDGGEIYYRSEDGWLVAVPVETSNDRFSAGKPLKLFEDRYASAGPVRSFDVTADGSFVFLTNPPEDVSRSALSEFFPDRIRVVQNWAEELRQRLPTDRQE